MVRNPDTFKMQWDPYNQAHVPAPYKLANFQENAVCKNCYPQLPSIVKTHDKISRLQRLMNSYSNYVICGNGLC